MNDPLLRRLSVVKIISSEPYRIRRGSPNILDQDPICLWGEDFEFAEFMENILCKRFSDETIGALYQSA